MKGAAQALIKRVRERLPPITRHAPSPCFPAPPTEPETLVMWPSLAGSRFPALRDRGGPELRHTLGGLGVYFGDGRPPYRLLEQSGKRYLCWTRDNNGMRVDGGHSRSIWLEADGRTVAII